MARMALEDIPKGGVTAGDVAIASQTAPTEPASPVEDKAPVGPQTPSDAPDPKVDPYGYLVYVMEQGFGSVHKRLNQQGELVANMAEKVYGGEGGGQAVGPKPEGLGAILNGDTIAKFLDLARTQLASPDPMQAYFAEMGKTFFDKTLETTMRSVTRQLGSQTAGAITHVG